MNIEHVMWRYRDAVPRKVRLAIADLVRIDMISEQTVDILGKAASVSNQPRHLLGFAIGMLDKRMKGIPVADTVNMAYELRRRVNLRWSPRRWREEHDKLSRLVTVKRLRDKNVEYDVTAFARHLPASWPGYLLKSSVKLGLEGHRQDHCVASYASLVEAGACAIATVLVDRKRWTVELVKTGKADAPLRIAQIHGKRNSKPTAAQRLAIHEVLELPPPSRAPDDEAPGWDAGNDRERPYAANLQRLLPVLRAHNVTAVRVAFAGGGDWGQIDEVHIHPAEAAQAMVMCAQSETERVNSQWVRRVSLREVTSEDAIRAITMDYLEYTGVDWCNDRGGEGHLEIDVGEGTVELMVERTLYADIVAIETGDSLL